MYMRYENERDILDLVENFENGTIPRGEWDHAGHLTAGLYYVATNGLDGGIERMRGSLLNHLKAIGVDFTVEMPYHETLTVFWMRTINDFFHSKNAYSIVDIRNELVEAFDKDFPLKFYTREYLFSDEARRNFVEPDLAG